MKKYIVIAGVNGAGKSTLYQMNKNLADMPRVNVDEIVKEIGDWKNVSDVFEAGKIAVKKFRCIYQMERHLIKRLHCVANPLLIILKERKH